MEQGQDSVLAKPRSFAGFSEGNNTTAGQPAAGGNPVFNAAFVDRLDTVAGYRGVDHVSAERTPRNVNLTAIQQGYIVVDESLVNVVSCLHSRESFRVL